MENNDRERIKELIKKYNRPDKVLLGIVSVVLIFFIVVLFVVKKDGRNILPAFIVIDVVLSVYFLSRLLTIRKFTKNLVSEDEIARVKGKPTKVVFLRQAYTRTNPFYILQYLILTIDNDDYLYVLPRRVRLKRDTSKPALKEKILAMEFDLKYYCNSKIIAADETALYRELTNIIAGGEANS